MDLKTNEKDYSGYESISIFKVPDEDHIEYQHIGIIEKVQQWISDIANKILSIIRK